MGDKSQSTRGVIMRLKVEKKFLISFNVCEG